MKPLDLYLLGRRLMKLGEEAMRGRDAPHVPTGLRLIVIDVTEHPDSSIGEIAERTGLPQSHVSQSVARLRARGAFETASDPRDGRRTLVRPGPLMAKRAARVLSGSVDAALGKAMDVTDPHALAEHVAALESVLAHMREARSATGSAGGKVDEAGSAWPLEDDE